MEQCKNTSKEKRQGKFEFLPCILIERNVLYEQKREHMGTDEEEKQPLHIAEQETQQIIEAK